MAILHRKEEKLQVVLGRLPRNYTHEEFVAMFIKLYSKDWGKIKAAYIKQSQDKEPGTVVRMPKPDLYLKQVLEIYLQNKDAKAAPAQQEAPAKVEPLEAAPVKATKSTTKAKKEAVVANEPMGSAKKAKAPAKQEDAVEKPIKKTAGKAKKEATADEGPVKKTATRKKVGANEEPAEAKKETKAATPVKKTASKKKADIDTASPKQKAEKAGTKKV